MKTSILCCVALSYALLAGAAGATVTVNFVYPENWSGKIGPAGIPHVLAELHKQFLNLGTQLPAGYDLKVEILDIYPGSDGVATSSGPVIESAVDRGDHSLEYRTSNREVRDASGNRYPNSYSGEAAQFGSTQGPPFVKLRYTLELQGAVVKSGEERIKDPSQRLTANGRKCVDSGESLCGTKVLLENWFRNTLVTASATK